MIDSTVEVPGAVVVEPAGLDDALVAAVTPDLGISPPTPDIGFVHRRGQDADLYLLINTGPTNRTFGIAPPGRGVTSSGMHCRAGARAAGRSAAHMGGRAGREYYSGAATYTTSIDLGPSTVGRRSTSAIARFLTPALRSAAWLALPTGSRCMVQSARLRVRVNDIDCGLAWAPPSGRDHRRAAQRRQQDRDHRVQHGSERPRRGRAHHAAGGGERSSLRPQIYDAGSGPSHGVGAIRSATRTDARSERLSLSRWVLAPHVIGRKGTLFTSRFRTGNSRPAPIYGSADRTVAGQSS